MDGITSIGHLAIRARNLDTLLPFLHRYPGFSRTVPPATDEGGIRLVYVRVTDTQYLEFFPNGEGTAPHRVKRLASITFASPWTTSIA